MAECPAMATGCEEQANISTCCLAVSWENNTVTYSSTAKAWTWPLQQHTAHAVVAFQQRTHALTVLLVRPRSPTPHASAVLSITPSTWGLWGSAQSGQQGGGAAHL